MITSDDFDEKLFLLMLSLSRRGAGPEFDLNTICSEANLEVTPQRLLAFASDYDGIFGSSNKGLKWVRFTLDANGRRHAIEIERRRKDGTLAGRLMKLPVGKGIWDVVKILIAAAVGWFGKSYFG